MSANIVSSSMPEALRTRNVRVGATVSVNTSSRPRSIFSVRAFQTPHSRKHRHEKLNLLRLNLSQVSKSIQQMVTCMKDCSALQRTFSFDTAERLVTDGRGSSFKI